MSITVAIHKNDETGSVLYSVFPIDDPEYWIDSFASEEEALSFIAKGQYIFAPEQSWCSLSMFKREQEKP